MGNCLSIRKERTQSLISETSTSSALIHNVQAPGVSDPLPECAQQEQGKEETPEPEDLPQHASCSSGSAMQMNENEEMVITSIRATTVALGLRRVPAGFYAVVHHSDLEWTTENKCSLAIDDVVEWNGPIPIPSDLSAAVCLEIYATFEFQSTSAGERLRELVTTTTELLDRSANDIPFNIFPKDGDVVSSCSSIFVAVERRTCENSDFLAPRVVTPHGPTTESRWELENATNQGHNALSRYITYRENRDLERSIEEFQRALSVCPLDHPRRAATISNLAMARVFCQVEDMDASFEVPLNLYRNALASCPVGHVDRPSTLIQLAMVHFTRLRKRGDEAEGARAEALLNEAIELSSPESREKRAADFMLQLLAEHRADPVQADGQLSAEANSAARLQDEDPWISSVQLIERFERFGDLADLQQAITLLEELVRSTSAGDHRYCVGLGNLGFALWHRFNNLGELGDMERSISMLRDAVGHIPHGHPGKPTFLNNLGNCFRARFERFGELDDLEQAISSHKDAVGLNPDEPGCLNDLGNAFFTRFLSLGGLSDLEDAISILRNAVNLIPHGHPHKPASLGNLANSLEARFQRFGEMGDLEDAISMLRNAVDLIPPGHPHKYPILGNFGVFLLSRFKRIGELADLEDAISTLRDVLVLIPHDHQRKPTHLGNLGTCLFTRFQRLGELADLEDAISTLRDGLALIPHDHHEKYDHLDTFGVCFYARFQRLGELNDLENAILILRDAVDLTPHGHPEKAGCLDHLGSSFLSRFRRLGQLSDLEDAILRYRDAADLTPHGHPSKPTYLNNLGNSLRARFDRLGELSDLEDAISMLRDAVDLTPHGHPGKPGFLNNLGISLKTRFDYLGELSDLEDAMSRHRDAVDLTPVGHPDRPSRLHNLGNSVKDRFERLGELSDLHDAISRHRGAVDLTPHGHPNKPSGLSNLGNSLVLRFQLIGELSDLEDGISKHRAAVDLTLHGHPDKPYYLHNLGNAFRARFKHLGELSDLQDAISMLKDAVDLTPDGHAYKTVLLGSLGDFFLFRFGRLRELRDLEDATSLYSHAAAALVGPVSIRFASAQKWITCAPLTRQHSLLDAYSIAISLLPQLAWIGLSLSDRYNKLTQGVNVVWEAAAAALRAGLPETAVEWPEQGRSIVWGELFQLRSSYEELSAAHPDHAQKLRVLSAALEHASTTHEKSMSAASEQTQNPGAPESLQQEADKHRRLAIERDKLLQEIRCLPGFEQFLLRKEFPQLRASAHTGPVVILNAAEWRCDALIVLADVDHVIHVPLPNFPFKRSTGLQRMLEELVGHPRAKPCDGRKGDPATLHGVSWESLLSTLWNCVVKPVLDALAFSTPGDLLRIFWCPTGPFVFLPIHAAGLYGTQHSEPGHKVSDFVISSYAPTVTILAPSSDPAAVSSEDLRLLLVRQPPSDGLPHLSGVATELKLIKEIVSHSPSAQTILQESSLGTIEEVVSLMKDANWVHFACHGIQEGTDSGLCLADRRRLKLRDIIALSRPHGGLAFLSACETATGDKGLSDEAIHIAAGMLFAGYEGVIGTMWSISDELAPRVARDVYAQLFRDGTRPDHREAARALHEAIGRLRDNSRASFATWLPFIHVGL